MNSYTTHHTNISSRLNYIWCSKMWCLKCLYLNPSQDSFQHLSRLLKMRSILHMCPGIWNSLEFCVGCRGQNLYAKTVIFILHKDFYFQFCQHVSFFVGFFKNVLFGFITWMAFAISLFLRQFLFHLLLIVWLVLLFAYRVLEEQIHTFHWSVYSIKSKLKILTGILLF